MSKSIKKATAVFLVIMVTVLTLCSCSTKLNGTYKSSGLISQSFTFSGDDKVTMSAFGINADGTYVIKGDKIIITYSASALGLSYDWEKSFKKDGKSIYIDGTEFVKQ